METRLESGNDSERRPRPRREGRIRLNAEVVLRRSGSTPYQVHVFDASPLGCKVEFVERPRLDEHVWVKFEGLNAIEAMVCWIDGFVVGVEFTQPIHPAVFDDLVRRLG